MKLLTVLFLATACTGCASVWDQAQASEAMRIANALIPPIEGYRKAHGTYPNALADIALPGQLAKEAIEQGVSYGPSYTDSSHYVLGIVVPGLVFDSSCGYGFGSRVIEQKWQCFVK